jgi:hypothetical protein
VATVIVFCASPGKKVSVPDVGVKSAPGVAGVPLSGAVVVKVIVIV